MHRLAGLIAAVVLGLFILILPAAGELFDASALSLSDAERKAGYDVLISAAIDIKHGDYEAAARMLAVLPDEIEALMRPVVTMREDLAAAEPIIPFAENDARAEIMKYHKEVWTVHPEFADDFTAFAEDFAKRASRREKIEGAPYIIAHLNDYGFVPRADGGPQQAYLFLWTKFNAISKFADVCDKLGLEYEKISIEKYSAAVSHNFSDRVFAANDEAYSREQGRMSWTELIDQYVPVTEEPPAAIEETSPVDEGPVEYTEPPAETEPLPPAVEESEPETGETPPVEEEAPPAITEPPEVSPEFEILVNPLSLFTPPSDAEAAKPAESETSTPPAKEEKPVKSTTVFNPPDAGQPATSTEKPADETDVTAEAPVSTFNHATSTASEEPAEFPSHVDALPVPPGDVTGTLAVGTPAESGPDDTSGTAPAMDSEEIKLKLAAIAEDSIDNAALKALNLGRNALELAKMLTDDPKHESDATKNQLDKFRSSRTEFLAATALIDRYSLEEYLDIPVELIEEEIVAELRRPYDDLKASPAWEDYRDKEADFDDAFARLASDFRARRTKESIYAGEMAALETHIVDYESSMLEIEELLSAFEAMESGDRG
jgi:hypothetical protein